MEFPGLFGEFAPDPGNVGVAPQPYVFDHELWERLRRDQMGVDVIDPLGHTIGMAKAINHRWNTWPVGPGLDWRPRLVTWAPVDGRKHVLVGEFDSFDTYQLEDKEFDYEFRIFPDPPFRFILDRVVARMSADDQDDLVRGQGGRLCVECEITPDRDFMDDFDDSWRPQPR